MKTDPDAVPPAAVAIIEVIARQVATSVASRVAFQEVARLREDVAELRRRRRPADDDHGPRRSKTSRACTSCERWTKRTGRSVARGAPPGSRSIDPASRPGRYYSHWVETPPEVAVSLLAERACLNEVVVVRDDVVGGALQVEAVIRSRLRRSRER